MERILILIILCVTGCIPSKKPFSLVEGKKIKSSRVILYDWSKYYEITDISITPATTSNTIPFSWLGCEFSLEFKMKLLNNKLDKTSSALEFQEIQVVTKNHFTSADDFDTQIAHDTIFILPKLRIVNLKKGKPKETITIQTKFNHFGSARHSKLTIVFQKQIYHYDTRWMKI